MMGKYPRAFYAFSSSPGQGATHPSMTPDLTGAEQVQLQLPGKQSNTTNPHGDRVVVWVHHVGIQPGLRLGRLAGDSS